VGQEERKGEKGRGREEGRDTGHHKPFGRGRGGGKSPNHIGSRL